VLRVDASEMLKTDSNIQHNTATTDGAKPSVEDINQNGMSNELQPQPARRTLAQLWADRPQLPVARNVVMLVSLILQGVKELFFRMFYPPWIFVVALFGLMPMFNVGGLDGFVVKVVALLVANDIDPIFSCDYDTQNPRSLTRWCHIGRIPLKIGFGLTPLELRIKM